jgi:hypothetical protein
VAVGLRFGDDFACDHAARPAAVVDDHRLSEADTQALGDNADHGVERVPGL